MQIRVRYGALYLMLSILHHDVLWKKSTFALKIITATIFVTAVNLNTVKLNWWTFESAFMLDMI